MSAEFEYFLNGALTAVCLWLYCEIRQLRKELEWRRGLAPGMESLSPRTASALATLVTEDGAFRLYRDGEKWRAAIAPFDVAFEDMPELACDAPYWNSAEEAVKAAIARAAGCEGKPA